VLLFGFVFSLLPPSPPAKIFFDALGVRIMILFLMRTFKPLPCKQYFVPTVHTDNFTYGYFYDISQVMFL